MQNLPTYRLDNLADLPVPVKDFSVDRFGHYLQEHRNLIFPHKHSFYQLIYFTKGTGTHAIDFQPFKVETGHIYFMIPGQMHRWDFKQEPDGYIVNFSQAYLDELLANPAYLDRFSFLSGHAISQAFTIAKNKRKQVEDCLENILREGLSNAWLKNDFIRTALLQLFITIDRYRGNHGNAATGTTTNQLIKQFRLLVDSHFKQRRLPKQYAELLHISANHLNAITKSATGISAGDLIRERVLLEAKRLLVNAQLTISEVAGELEFEDNSYFTRFFRKYENMTPVDFRKKNWQAYPINELKRQAMNKQEKQPGLVSLLACKCPRCRQGNMFVDNNPWHLKRTMKMRERCEVCEQPFDIEVGFYYGSSYISYAFSIALSVASFIAWWLIIGISLNDNRVLYWLPVNAILLLALQPYLMRVARTIWLAFFIRYNKNWKNESPKRPERTNAAHQHNW